jgi:O-antigen/teichoic acid export membrane protein
VAFGLLSAVLLVAGVTALRYPPYLIRALAVAALALVSLNLSSVGEWTAIALGRLRLVASLATATAVLQAVLAMWVLAAGSSGNSLTRLFGATTLVSALNAGCYCILIVGWMRPAHLRTSLREARSWVSAYLPLFWMGALGTASRRLDVPLLAQMAGLNATGIYTAALRLTQPLSLLRSMAFQAVFPPYTAISRRDPARGQSALTGAVMLSTVVVNALALIMISLSLPLT